MVGFQVKRLLAYVSGNNRHNDGASCQDIEGVLHQRLSSLSSAWLSTLSSTHTTTSGRHMDYATGDQHHD